MHTHLEEYGRTLSIRGTEISRLHLVTFVHFKPMYALRRFPGAMRRPYLAEPTIELLVKASATLARRGYELLIWDAYRTRPTQRHIFDLYKQQLAADLPELGQRELHAQTCSFVSDPASVFPHGTGGAVDATLMRQGREANLGTDFDDFSDRSAVNFFRRYPPACAEDREADFNREVLREVLLDVGFVGIESEWWHFEAFTRRWAGSMNTAATLIKVLEHPIEADSALMVKQNNEGFVGPVQAGRPPRNVPGTETQDTEGDSASVAATWSSLQILPRFILDDVGRVVEAPAQIEET